MHVYVQMRKTHQLTRLSSMETTSSEYVAIAGENPTVTAAGGEEEVQQPAAAPSEVKTMKVMVAIDESDGSFHALHWALDNILTLGGAPPVEDTVRLTVVHVQQPFQHFIYPAGPVGHATAVYATTTVLESVRKAQEHNSAILLSRALQMCTAKNVKAETLVLNGDPKEMICGAAEQMHVDLLVIGSRGLGTLKRAFLGSVSDYCAHHTKCAILIVKPPKEKEAKGDHH